MLGRGRTPNPWRETLPSGTRNRKDLVVEESTTSPEKKYHCQWTFLRESASIPTTCNWIDDRFERLKLQNLALAMEGPVMSSSPKILTADVQHAANKCEGGLWETIDPSGESTGNCKGFSRIWQSFDVIFCRMCISSAACYFRAPSVAILTSLRPVVNPLPGCSLWKTRSRPIGVRVCPVAQFDFISTAFDPRVWTMVVFWKDDPPDNLGFPPGLPPAPPPAGGERTRAVDQSRERSRPRSPEPQLIHNPMSDGDDDQTPQTTTQRHRSRSRERSYPHAQVPQGPQVQPMIIQEPVTDPDEDPTVVNPSSSS